MPTSATFLLALYLGIVACDLALDLLNLRHLRRHGGEIPPPFAGTIDAGILARTTAYTVDSKRLGILESLLESALLLLFLFTGILAGYDRWVAGCTDSFVAGGLLFFLGLILVKTAVAIPFSLFRTFVIEKRYGFNTTTLRLWLSDLGKSTFVSLLLAGILAAGALWLVQTSPLFWWLWVWGLFASITLLLIYLSPYLIEPLFFKFKPLDAEGLEKAVKDLMAKGGVAVSRVFKVDASRRSRHSNAYFTGLGRVKRIVLFDTLLEQMGEPEILAVLAHELGHWRLRHVAWRLLGIQTMALIASWLAFHLIEGGGLPHLVGLESASFPAQLVILSFLAGLLGFFLAPIGNALSRRHEWQADRFACELTGRPHDLAAALIKLARENLANLHPHPLYAWFHYSHPPLPARVARLQSAAVPSGKSA